MIWVRLIAGSFGVFGNKTIRNKKPTRASFDVEAQAVLPYRLCHTLSIGHLSYGRTIYRPNTDGNGRFMNGIVMGIHFTISQVLVCSWFHL